MPFIVPFVPLIAAAAAATTTGLEASGAIGGNNGPSAQSLETAQNQQQQAAAQKQEQAAFKGFEGNAQAQTGGALGDPSLSALIAELSGSPADTNLAQQTLFGNSPSLSTTNSNAQGLSTTSVGGGQ